MRKGLLLINQNVKTRVIEVDARFYRRYEVIGWDIRQTGDLKSVFFIPLEARKYDSLLEAEKSLSYFVDEFNRQLIGEGSVRKTLLERISKIRLFFDDGTIDNLFEFIKEYVVDD